jgi:VanZ family protein
MATVSWKRRASLWLPALLYMAIIFHFSSQPDPLPEIRTHVWDKLLHCTEYIGLAFLVCRALAGEGLAWRMAFAIAILAASLYGASDEWHQAYVPNRSSDVHDWVADSIGGIVGVAAFGAVSTASRRRRRHPR